MKPTVDPATVNSKTDSELLQIWTYQGDYVAEMVALAGEEIGRRQLDTSGIRVRTADELEHERQVAEAHRNFRAMSLRQGGLGILVVLCAFFLDLPVLLGLALLIALWAVGTWRRQRWAIVSGFFFYSAVAVVGVLAVMLNVGELLMGQGKAEDHVIGALNTMLGACWSAYSASCCNLLRKEGSGRRTIDGSRSSE
jgi:hypothetical protein